MVLPHQMPLYEAYDAVETDDFARAEAAIKQFFDALENDSIAQGCRRQHVDRQVFEADFLSILTKEEIDAWSVLVTVKLHRDDLEGARADCYRMIELMDQHYGFETPSWKSPEVRIPLNPELMDRYHRVAAYLAYICAQENDLELSKRWDNVSKTTVADREHPDEVWRRWIASDDAEPVSSMSAYEFLDWPIEQVEADGRTWMVKLYRSLSQRASPVVTNWLVRVTIPTSEAAEVPAKAQRWRIWSLRQAITIRLRSNDLGVFFGELQSRGSRVLLYYVKSELEARLAIEPIFEKVSDLHPTIEIRKDLGWKEYAKWGGQSIVLQPPTAVPMPVPIDEESENDKFLKGAWRFIESIHDTWLRLYTLLWIIDLVPPQADDLKQYCLTYLFGLVQELSGKKKVTALIHMIWKLPNVDGDAAIRAFDELWHEPLPLDDETVLSLAAEAFAATDPYRALKIAEALMNKGYSLVYRAMGQIANRLAVDNPNLALEIIQTARRSIITNDEQVFSKATYLSELVADAAGVSADLAREILIESLEFAQQVPDNYTKHQVYLAILEHAEKLSADLLPAICKRAIEVAFQLEEKDPNSWFGFGGPTMAVSALTMIAPRVATYDQPAALELLLKSLEMTQGVEGDSLSQMLLLSNVAEAASALSGSLNRTLAEKVWIALIDCMTEAGVSPDAFFLNERYQASGSPIKSFVLMNPTLAIEKFDSILVLCKSVILPEREVNLLCSFAVLLDKEFPERAKELLGLAETRANDCSSEYLRAISLVQVAAAKSKEGLDCNAACEIALTMIRNIPSQQSRFDLLLESAKWLSDSLPVLSVQLIDEALTLAENENANLNQGIVLEQLNRMPARQCSPSFFRWLSINEDKSRLTEVLSRWAGRYADQKN